MQQIKIFLSSPGDVRKERQKAAREIQRLAGLQHINRHFSLSTFAYEDNVPAEIGDTPQRTVDRYLRPSEADIVVCILSQRMGTPVTDPESGERFSSGTEYEFVDAYRACQRQGRPRILLYRVQAEPSERTDRDQFKLVEAFFRRFDGEDADFRGLWKSVRPGRFQRAFFYDLDALITRWFPSDQARPVASIGSRRDESFERHPLPANYVERGDVLSALKANLLDASRGARPVALHAMGGAGKSVLARALCNEPDVRRAFPDGILWVELGQSPDLMSELTRLVHRLGGVVAGHAPSQEDVRDELARLLARRTALLVLDNVWRRGHAEPFVADSLHSRILLTTRDAELARELGATIHTVPLMRSEEGVTLLSEWSEGSTADSPIAEQIVSRLGFLPLAVKLAGAQLRGVDPVAWLRAFDARRLVSKRPESPSDSFPETFGLSLTTLSGEVRELYALLVIFKPGEPIPRQAIERLWSSVKGMASDDVERMLDDLESRALIEINESEAVHTVSIHDLVRDLLLAALDQEVRTAANRALMRSYQGSSSTWHTVADDGYLFDHLAYHLEAAEAADEVERLFDDPQWMYARLRQSAYQYDGYLADLDSAWKHAVARAPEDDRALVACARYALIRSSVHSIAANHVPVLVARAVETGLWPAMRALRVASRIPEAKARIEMLITLLGVGSLTAQERLEAADLALDASQADGARLLAELAKVIDPSRVPRALDIALALNESSAASKALAGLAPLVDPHMTSGIVDRALQLHEEWYRSPILAACGPAIPSNRLVSVLAHALQFERSDLCGQVLVAIAPRLAELESDEAQVAFWACLAGTRRLSSDDAAQVLGALGPLVSGKALEEALQIAMTNAPGREKAVAAIAPHLDQGALRRALDNVLEWGEEWRKAPALAAIAPALTGDLAELALRAAVEFRAKHAGLVLMALAPRATDEGRSKIARWALEQARSEGVPLLIELLPHLSAADRTRVFEWALADSSPWVLVELLSHLSGDDFTKARECAVKVARWVNERGEYLQRLMRHFTGQEKQAVLRAAVEKEFESLLSSDGRIVDVAVRDGNDELLAWLIERSLVGDRSARALIHLAPRLDETQLWRALALSLPEAAKTDVNAAIDTSLLEALVPHLNASMLKHAVTLVLQIPWDWRRDAPLQAIAPWLGEDLLRFTLDHAAVIADREAYASCILHLSARANPEKKALAHERALDAVLGIQDLSDRAMALRNLAPHLPSALMARAVEAACALPIEGRVALSSKSLRLWALSELVLHVKSDLAWRAAQEGWSQLEARPDPETLSGYARELSDRRTLEAAQVLAAAAGSLEGERQQQAVSKAFHTVFELTSDWDRVHLIEGLAPHLTGADLQKVTEAALAFYPPARIAAMRALARRLSGTDGIVAWSAVLDAIAIAYKHDSELRSVFLSNDASEIDEHLLNRCFDSVPGFDEEKHKSRVLEALAPRLDDALLERALEWATAFRDPEARADALVALAGKLTGIRREEVLLSAAAAASAIPSPLYRALTFANLASCLTGASRTAAVAEGVRGAESIEELDRRARVLASYLKLAEDTRDVVARVRRAITQELHLRWGGQRERVLSFCASEDLFVSPVLSENATASLLDAVSAIREWRWP